MAGAETAQQDKPLATQFTESMKVSNVGPALHPRTSEVFINTVKAVNMPEADAGKEQAPESDNAQKQNVSPRNSESRSCLQGEPEKTEPKRGGPRSV